MPQAAPIMETVMARVMPSDAYMIAGVPSLHTPAVQYVVRKPRRISRYWQKSDYLAL